MITINNYEKGIKRDKKIFNLLEDQTCMTSEMIHLLLFKGNCLRITQRRLTILSTPPYPKINRDRWRLADPYFYFMGHRPGQLEHVLGVSWVYTWINLTLANMDRLHSFEREVKEFKSIRPDAFCVIKSLWQDAFFFYFIELDINTSGHDFGKKAKKYNDLFESEYCSEMWWAEHTKKFPPIIVVTTGKLKTIKEKIDRVNTHNLDFRVYSLDQIKEECQNGSSSVRSIWTK